MPIPGVRGGTPLFGLYGYAGQGTVNCLHFFLKSTDLVRNIDPISSYFVSNLDLATTIQRPTSVRWQVIEIGGKRNLITHFPDLRD